MKLQTDHLTWVTGQPHLAWGRKEMALKEWPSWQGRPNVTRHGASEERPSLKIPSPGNQLIKACPFSGDNASHHPDARDIKAAGDTP